MNKIYYLLTSYILMLLVLSGCAVSSAVSESNAVVASDASLDNAKTFAWLQPEPVAAISYDKGYSGELDKNLRRAVREELIQKGMQEVTEQPDVLVAYDVSVAVPEEKERTENYLPGFGYGYAYMAGYRYDYKNANILGYRSVDLYKQGTLIIDVVDPVTKQLLWRGWSEGAVTDPAARYAKIQGQVEAVLQKLQL